MRDESKHMNYRLLLLFYFINCSLIAQEITLQLRDSLSGETIPFATVMTNFGENAISNEEGLFRLNREAFFVPEDSLFISCMGFKAFGEAIKQLSDSLLFLSPKAIELNAVILSQNNLSAVQVVKKARERVKDKYDLSLTKKTFFLRESFDQRWVQRDLKVKKATIKEFNQVFWDSLFKTIPIKDDWHTESYGELYGDWSEEQQKLVVKRAVELADTVNEKGYEQIENKITTVLDENVKENSYFKFKSGIFSTKVDREEVIEQPKDSTQTALVAEKEEEEFPKEEAFYRGRKNRLKGLFTSLIKRDRMDISVLNKSHLYDYEIVNFTYMDGTPVYIIDFQPNGKKGKYKGTLYIEADQYSLIQMDYENVRSIRDFSLLGLSFNMHGRKTQLKFGRFKGGKYQLQYLNIETKFRTGIERPIKILEKNKYVKGRRKQNELSGKIHFKLEQKSNVTLVIFNSEKVSKASFEALKETKVFTPAKRDSYDPSFWEGYTIMEPNKAIKAFTAN
jgi:hypothetical protein